MWVIFVLEKPGQSAYRRHYEWRPTEKWCKQLHYTITHKANMSVVINSEGAMHWMHGALSYSSYLLLLCVYG